MPVIGQCNRGEGAGGWVGDGSGDMLNWENLRFKYSQILEGGFKIN